MADPALWKATRGDQTVYIFGTLHAGRGDDTWRSAAVLNAYNAAGTIILETDTHNGPALTADMRRLGTAQPGITLSAQLSPKLRPVLYRAAAHKQLPLAGVERLRPWLAALVLARGDGLAIGPDPFLDRIIESDARAHGKWLIYLERPEDQYQRLAALPDDLALAFLGESLSVNPDQQTALTRAWQSGDTETLDTFLNGQRRMAAPALDAALITAPNAKWAEAINLIARTDKIVFVAIGAAHTVGPASLPEQLQTRGFQVQRANKG